MRYLSRQMIAHVREYRSNWDHGAWILIIIASGCCAVVHGLGVLLTAEPLQLSQSKCGTRISFRESGRDRGWRDGGARWRSSAAGSYPPDR